MIHRLSELLTQYFMKYGQATDKAEVYIYGIECFISEFIGNLWECPKVCVNLQTDVR